MTDANYREIALLSYGISIGACLDAADRAPGLGAVIVLYLLVALFAHAAVVEFDRLLHPPGADEPDGDAL